MKHIIMFSVFLLLLFSCPLNAQTDTSVYKIRNYSITLNKHYYIVTMENEILSGVFLAVNSGDVLIKEDDENEAIVMPKSEIKKISSEYPKSSDLTPYDPIKVLSSRWCFGGGAVLNKYSKPYYKSYEFTGNSNNTAGKYSFGCQFFANYTAVFTRNIALRTDFEYLHEFSDVMEYNGDNYYSTGDYTRVSGGSLDEVCVKLMFGIGNFVPEDEVSINLFLGIGAGIRYTGGMTYYSNTTYYHELTEEKDAYSTFTVLVSSSIFFGYTPWKNAGIFLEPQINMWGITRMPVQVSLKAGIMF